MNKKILDLFFYVNKNNLKATQEYLYNVLKRYTLKSAAWEFSIAIEEVILNIFRHDYKEEGPIYIKVIGSAEYLGATIFDFNSNPHYEPINKRTGYRLLESIVDKIIIDENYAIGKKVVLIKLLKKGDIDEYEDVTYNLAHNFAEKITGFQSLNWIMGSLKKVYNEKKGLSFIFIGLSSIQPFESFLGYKAYDLIIKGVSTSLTLLKEREVLGRWIVAQPVEFSDHFLIFLPDVVRAKLNSRKIAKVLNTIRREIINALQYFIEEQLIEKFDIYTEFCELKYEPNMRFERLLWRKINEEIKSSLVNEDAMLRLMERELKIILEKKAINSLFQGIYDKDNNLIGYEALARGPNGSVLFFPEALFSTAYKIGKVLDLELISLEAHISNFNKSGIKDKKLFINIESLALLKRTASIMSILDRLAIDPQNIVIELTERTLISDIGAFKEKLTRIKETGVKIAIDDVGSGYSNLVLLAELHPDILKFDMNIIRGIHSDKFRRGVIETIVKFGRSLNAKIVAEGIEDGRDLEILRNFKIDYFQGFYFDKPGEI